MMEMMMQDVLKVAADGAGFVFRKYQEHNLPSVEEVDTD